SLEAGLVDRAVVFHLLRVPAAADTGNEPPTRDLVKRGDELCRLDRVALDDQAHPGAELEPPGRGGGRAQRNKRIHHIVVLALEFAAAWHVETAVNRDVRVLGHPQRLETALLERRSELGGGDRVFGEEDRSADVHGNAPLSRCALAVDLAGDGAG